MSKNPNKELLFFIILPIIIGCIRIAIDYRVSKTHKVRVVDTTHVIDFDFNGDTLLEIEGDGTVTKYYEHNE